MRSDLRSVPAPPFDLSVADAVAAIRQKNGGINAYTSLRLDAALEEATRRAESDGPLRGVPFGLKDEWETTCLPTTAGSYRHRARTSPRDSAVYRVFHDAGATLVGKTNLSDMGIVPESTNYVCGATRNPHDPARTAGGSSGGAAAAVAARMQSFDWGTDIGGSIRLPAAFCGVFGLRLSSEVWPLSDLFPTVPAAISWMCGQGPIARTIPEISALLAVARSLRAPSHRSFHPKRACLYVPHDLGEWPTFEQDARELARRAWGLEATVDARLPSTRVVRRSYSAVWASHFDDLLSSDPSLSLREGTRAVLSALAFRGSFGDKRIHPTSAELLALIALGRMTIFRDREKALALAAALRAKFWEVWSEDTFIVAPVCMYPAPKLGRSNYNLNLLSCTMSGNLTDATALSVPFGSFGPMPRAFQLMGPPGSEEALLKLAEECEQPCGAM